MPEKSRVKIPVPKSLNQAEALLGEMAIATRQLQNATSEMNGRLDAIRKEYEPVIGSSNDHLTAQRMALEAWAWEAQKAEFAEKRSLDLLHGTIGFRFGKPKLATLARMTWEKALDKIKSLRPEYVRTKEEVNKERMLEDFKSGLLDSAALSASGLKMVQEEVFFVELKS